MKINTRKAMSPSDKNIITDRWKGRRSVKRTPEEKI
jgi:hypothetical protein